MNHGARVIARRWLGAALLGAGGVSCSGDAGPAASLPGVHADGLSLSNESGWIKEPFRVALGQRARSLAGHRGPRIEARGPARLAEGVQVRAGGLEARVRLVGARDAAGQLREGGQWFDGALGPGTAALVRADDAGFEDHLFLTAPLPGDEARYALEPGEGAAGLRLVGGVIEILDRGGAPRLRMEAPFVIDAGGRRREASVRVEGCAVDRSPQAPWGRTPTPPGAASCQVVVSWGGGLDYPILVDPAWTTTGAMAFARTRHELHALPSGRALTFGGTDDNGALASAEVFDPGSETWAMVGGLATSRYHYASVTLASGEVLVAGGLNDTDGSLASAELYDPASGKFAELPAMHAARAFLTATLLADGRALIVGGCVYDPGTSNCDPTKGPAEIFDPTTKSFTQVGSLQQPRHAHHAARLKDNSVLIVSGTDGTFLLDSTESFDPQTQQFKAGKPVLQARTFGAMGALSDGVIVSTGGLSLDSNPILDSCEYLDPQGAGWFSCPSFNPPRYGHRSLLLPDGQFLLLGGTSALGEISVGEQISSELDSMWIEGAETKLKGARAYLAAVVLGTGQALVSGGMADMTALKSTELFGKGVAGLSCVSNGECTSQHCIDGFCCDTACNAPCLGCSAKVKGQGPNGVCGPVVAGTDPHGGCPDYPVTLCAESGACDGQGACALYPAGTACATPSCLAGVRTTASCASKNTCLPEQHPCAPYACGPDGQNCGSSCAGDEGCDEKAFCEGGACVKRAPSGQPCTAGHACLSGFCADGVCCDSACLGQCESCGVAPNVGACSPQAPGSAPAAGKPACAGDGACGGHCDGVSRAACTYPGPLTTCAASCSGGRETQDRCDGLGHCSSQPTRDCAPYACGPDACLTSCAADTDCTVGYTCMDKACIPRSAARCLGDHTLQGPDGSIRDCSPYRCSAEGACLQACDTTLDCATGQTCRSDRSCRPDIAPPAPADAGCGCRLAPPGRSAPPALALGLVALVALARRRRVCSAR